MNTTQIGTTLIAAALITIAIAVTYARAQYRTRRNLSDFFADARKDGVDFTEYGFTQQEVEPGVFIIEGDGQALAKLIKDQMDKDEGENK